MSGRVLRCRKSKIFENGIQIAVVKPEPNTTPVKCEPGLHQVETEQGITITSHSLRPRKQGKLYEFQEDENNTDDSYHAEDVVESNSESESDSGLFAKKKRKLNDHNVYSKLSAHNEENEYRLQRQRNLQDRFKILNKLDFKEEVEEIKLNTPPPKVTPKPRPKSKKAPSKAPPRPSQAPTKRSLRLLNKSLNSPLLDADAKTELQFDTANVHDESLEPSRFTDEFIGMVDDGAEEDLLAALQNLKTDLSIPFEPDSDFCSCDLAKFTETVKTCQMRDAPIKAINSRITALDIHPSQKKLIFIMGDKGGHISIRDITKENGIECRPHARSSNCVSFGVQDNTKFFSTSLEGTVRQGDVNSSNLQLVYNAAADEHTTWHHEFGHSLLIAEGVGTVKLIDLRTPGDNYVNFNCHPRSVRTVQLHPTNENYFLTGSGYGEFGIWDIRQGNAKKQEPIILQPFDKALTSAFFSPQGNYVLTTCNDDTIRVFDVMGLQTSTQVSKVTHNNHAGRWLSVFKAKWQPQREDVFFVGSMMTNPKRMQIYQRNGKMLHQLVSPELNTICPVIVAHSTLPIYVGGSGSGKLNVFSPYSSLSELFS